ncbi:MAG: isoaspartyl peptidase/L-asparaginase [Deltaproteobacteria bacterium]|nr:isoaspartyl peptidase/L-asparaginase [Deltaproteobacteria bacterium]
MKIVIHGGAGSRKGSAPHIHDALKEIYLKAESCLKKHSALDTVIYAVTLLEDCPLFNAGTGSQLQKDGRIRMSAAVMDGKSEQFSAVLNIEQVRNPILIAKALIQEKDRILAAECATRFARAHGFAAYNPKTKERVKEWKKRVGESGMGTVGACAVDRKGCLAAATSTGGRGFERPGRVSDSGTPAGNYANAFAAVSATGIGEQIVNEALAAKIVIRVSDGMTLLRAFKKSFHEVRNHHYHMGAIGISRLGEVMVDFSTEKINAAYRDKKKALVVLS